ncbi:MAG: hypothetical protein KGK18_04335, partial [Burkholderiales bacterium]|nr:hypothetical protein [Burkholderiales bacterium]
GGWSWYTGSAAWLHRAAIENMFGLQLRAGEIAFAPCLPSHWDHAELTLRRDDRTLRVILCRPGAIAALEAARRASAAELSAGQWLRWDTLPAQSSCLVRLPAAAPPAEAAEVTAPPTTGAPAASAATH